MKKPLFIKFALMAAVMLLLLIPISQIDGLIQERQHLQQRVLDDIAQSASRSQIVFGPVLMQPYVRTEKVWRHDKSSGEKFQEDVDVQGVIPLLPEYLRVDSKLESETRHRGIYAAHLYHADSRLSGHFTLAKHLDLENFSNYRFSKPYIVIATSDMRGFESTVTLSIDDHDHQFIPGAGHRAFAEGIHANLDSLEFSNDQKINFNVNFTLQGTEQLAFIPVGKESYVHLQSDWPHPSFQGQYLPIEHTIDENGFSAKWRASYFSTNMENIVNKCVLEGNCNSLKQKAFHVSLIDPVDFYVKSDRAIKYALLFIVLTFAGFFLFELLKSLKVHPVQYALVGLALAMFYLLLMSLAEHIDFGWSYFIAASACVSLISFYISYSLHSLQRATGFGVGLGLLYAMLYGLLSSEDYALLMGSLLIFAVLAAFMVLTRKLDWYVLSANITPEPNKISVPATKTATKE